MDGPACLFCGNETFFCYEFHLEKPARPFFLLGPANVRQFRGKNNMENVVKFSVFAGETMAKKPEKRFLPLKTSAAWPI